MYMLNIIDSINKVAESFKGWIIENGSNPILWIGIILGGLAIFGITYNALSKNK